MTISKENNTEDFKHQVIAMDNELVKQTLKMDVEYQKMFYIALSYITDQNSKENNIVEIDKKTFFDLVGATATNRHTRYKEMWQNLIPMTLYSFGKEIEYDTGVLIYKVKSTRYKYYVYFESEYMPLLCELSEDFTRLLRADILKFNSKFSTILYQHLMRLNGLRYRGINFTTKQLKDIFGLDEDAYTSTYRGKKKFDRKRFELRTIDVAVKEINESAKCVQNLRYEKMKDNRGQVEAYVFYYDYIDPAVARERPQQIGDVVVEQTTLDEFLSYEKFPKEIRDFNPFEEK